MDQHDRIYVAGHTGLVGTALVKRLGKEGFSHLILQSSRELDLRNQEAVSRFYRKEQPDFVIVAAARVGGILANDLYSAEFLYDNLMIAANLIHGAWEHKVKKLLFLGSSCVYPASTPQPMKESQLLTAPLEPTNEAYAMAKLSGIMMCRHYRKQYGADFISALPTNLYGPHDHFDLQTAHVLPALIRKFHEAVVEQRATVEIWGTGTPVREFMHVDDLADACLFLMKHYSSKEPINVESGEEISIRDLAEMIRKVTGYKGEIVYDPTKPEGVSRKLLDTSKLRQLGWESGISLPQGIKETYQWYQTALREDQHAT